MPHVRKTHHVATHHRVSKPVTRPTTTPKATGTATTDGFDGGASSAPIAIAQSVLQRNIQDLKTSGPLAGLLDKAPSSHVCCANFVSACLQKAGEIKPSEHNDSVKGLAKNLGNDARWSKVSSSAMKPGDVVCFQVPGEGHMAHVEMFAGYKNGVPQFIGSNNVNRDGTQSISLDSGRWAHAFHVLQAP